MRNNTKPFELKEVKFTWSRDELIRATGLCHKTLCNLEARGLLKRVNAGIQKALYTDDSVRALFCEQKD
jgi:hypothetical protein